MSKFLDRLDRISRGSSSPMGFGSASRAEKTPSMALVGLLSHSYLDSASLLAEVGVDGVLIEGLDKGTQFRQVTNILGALPWGIGGKHLNEEIAKSHREQGCDFFSFSVDNITSATLSEEDSAYLLEIAPDFDDRSLRAIECLPLDAVVLNVNPGWSSLALRDLIAIGSIRSMLDKYLLLQGPVSVTAGELIVLKEIGVDGLVVDVSECPKKTLQQLKENLMSMPKPRKSTSSKGESSLSSSAYRLSQAPSFDDEDDDE